MAAVFLATLFEYSPLFYIIVVSLCFVVTAAVVLGWCGFDVPVILRSPDEAESILPAPEKQMIRVTNPFGLDLVSSPASVTDGVSVRSRCLEPCVLSCFWGCEVIALQGTLLAHQNGLKLSSPQHFHEALHLRYRHCQTFHVSTEDSKEHHIQMPRDHGITDFGPLPRKHYPLVAVLTLAEPEARNNYNIVASVTVIHLPDDKYTLSARILFQYLLTCQGNMYELKPLFMSADSTRPSKPMEEDHGVEQSALLEEDDWSEGTSRDCVVCQNAAVNRVLLPCRHACVCDGCVSHFQHCPICRAFVMESFVLTQSSAT